jgi:hypothetical protein
MFHTQDGLYFRRNEDGSVTILKTNDGKEPLTNVPPEDSNIAFSQTLDAGSWCSVVLSMTAFSERPGDWHAWMKHHCGKEDLLEGKRGGY